MNPLLKSLVEICSVPGNETELRDFLIPQFANYGAIVQTKWTGFYCEYKHNRPDKGRKKVVITAHMDSPGFIVKDIAEDGTLRFISLGGIRPSTANLRSIVLRAGKKSFPGILSRCNSGEEDSRSTLYQGYFGFSSQAAAKKAGVQIGDSACFHSPVLSLQNDHVVAPHLDNRLGIFLLLDIAAHLPTKDPGCNIYFAATSCEEMGGRCAKIIARMIEPDIAVCIDTTYAEGSVQMGKGAVITLSDAAVLLPTKVRDQLRDIARSSKIPLQFEVYNYAGTDAKDFRDAGNGCLTLSTLIATLNNHSAHEICSLKDIEYTRKFVLALLKKLDNLKV